MIGWMLATLAMTADTPAPRGATTLTGTFLGTIQRSEYEDALLLDEDLMSMDSRTIVRLTDKPSTAVDTALDGLTMISMVNAEAPGKRIRAACSAKCRVSGTIVQIERNAWWFKTVTAVAALPDSYDFAAASDRFGGPAKPGPATNGEPPRAIGPADPLRKPLLDALRPAIERDLRQPVQFVVKGLRKQNDWAFATVVPQAKGGGRIDYAGTRHAEALRAGAFDGGTAYALLQNKAGQWVVRTFVIGPTDVAWASWPEEYGAPYPLLGLTPP